VVYNGQDSLGLKSWGTYAKEAGLADTAAISKCATDPSPVSRIEAGVALGHKLRITGTPTVLVNGWRFHYPPTEEELKNVIDRIAKGRVPFDTSTH
jgi:protein-disulfide isomerase